MSSIKSITPRRRWENEIELVHMYRRTYLESIEAVRRAGVGLRVLFPFYSDKVGGAEMSAVLLMEGMVDLGVKVYYVAPQNSEVKRFIGSCGEFNELDMSAVDVESKCLSEYLKGVKIIVDEGIILVHTNDQKEHRYWATIAEIFGIIHVLHYRNKNLIENRLGSIDINLYRKSFVVYISRFVAEMSKIKGVGSEVVYNPILRNNSKFLHRTSSAEPVRLVYAGRFVGYKHFEMLAYVYGYLVSNGVPQNKVECVFYGADEKAVNVIKKECASAYVFSKMHFRGWSNSLFNELAVNSIVICPAIGEAFGRLAAECCMNGVPLVAADSGGHKEIVPHNGLCLLYEPGNIEDCAIQVLSIMNKIIDVEYKAESLGNEYSDELARRHDPKKHSKEIYRIYNKLISRK